MKRNNRLKVAVLFGLIAFAMGGNVFADSISMDVPGLLNTFDSDSPAPAILTVTTPDDPRTREEKEGQTGPEYTWTILDKDDEISAGLDMGGINDPTKRLQVTGKIGGKYSVYVEVVIHWPCAKDTGEVPDFVDQIVCPVTIVEIKNLRIIPSVITANGISTATATADIIPSDRTIKWSFASPDLGCTLAASGNASAVITAGTIIGVVAVSANDSVMTFYAAPPTAEVQLVRTWKINAESSVVMVDGEGNYVAPKEGEVSYGQAKMKAITITSPDINSAFKLKVSKKLDVYDSTQKTQLDDSSNKDSEISLTTDNTGSVTVFIKGRAPAENEAPSARASTKTDDDTIELIVDNPNKPVDTAKFTVLWVDVSIHAKEGEKIPDDYSGKRLFTFLIGQPTLGLTGENIQGAIFNYGNAVLVKGDVKPNDFKGKEFGLPRYIVGNRTYTLAPSSTGSTYDSAGTYPDTSDPYFMDLDPQSGNSKGVIYDADNPGPSGRMMNTNSVIANPDVAIGTKIASRYKFKECSTYSGERCSRILPWYAKRAGEKSTKTCRWTKIDGEPQGDNVPDNTAGEEKPISLGFDEKPPLDFFVNLIVSPMYHADKGDFNAYAQVTAPDNYAPFTFKWQVDGGQLKLGQANMVFPLDIQNYPGTFDHSKHTIQVEVTSANAKFAMAKVIGIALNRPPVVQINKAKLTNNGDNYSVNLNLTISDPDNDKLDDEAMVQLLYTDEDGGYGATKSQPIPKEGSIVNFTSTKKMVTIVVCVSIMDKHNTVGRGIAVAE